MSESAEPTGAVVPLDGSTDTDLLAADPWRMLAEGTGLLVTWQDPPRRVGDSWGPSLGATSALASQLAAIVSRVGGGSAAGAGSALFRLELPTGSTLQHLVPAVGGGFRGLVRTGEGGTAIAGHARLVAVGGGAVGTGVALGPLVALLALPVGAEMLARHQQNKKLDAIRRGVRDLGRAADEKMAAQLQSAEQALEFGSAAMLDRIEVPGSIGLGPARDNLRVIKNRGLGWLDGWETRVHCVKSGRTGVDFGKMREILAGSDSQDSEYRKFPARVQMLYKALALDSRALVVHAAEVALKRPDETLPHVQRYLKRELGANAEAQDRLKEVLWKLAELRITYSLPALRSTGRDVAALFQVLAQLAAGVSRLPDAPALLSTDNRQLLEVLRDRDGSIRVLQPRPAAT